MGLLKKKLSYVNAKLGKVLKRWKARLLPRNSKDTWRGPMPYHSGLERRAHGSFPSTSFFLLRRVHTRAAVSRYVYTILFLWRYRWWVSIPLNSAVLYNVGSSYKLPSRPTLHTSIASGYTNTEGFRYFLEKTSVEVSHFPLNSRVGAFWGTVLRGIGGVTRVKLRFKGKSFKWHRRNGALMLRFGHSHLVALTPYPGVRWRRFGRMKIVLFGSNWWDLVDFAQAVCWWRPVNVYHGRGIRLRRQAVLRKAGKVSAYR